MENQELVVDFTLINTRRRKYLFFKRPKGTPVPVGVRWRCICGCDNKLTEAVEQFCMSCGSKLRLQENKEDNSHYWTCVIVSHINNSPR